MRRLPLPSLADILLAALAAWVFAATLAGTGVLIDASAGVHVKTGEWVLEHGSVPRADPFTFTKLGQPWFAWEWLADVAMALVWRVGGFRGLIASAALLVALAAWLLLLRMKRAGVGALAALVALHLWIGASSVHFLARPHLLTLVLFGAALWLLDSDLPPSWHWWLVPLTAVWANLHGGFAALPVTLLIVAAGRALEGDGAGARRSCLLCGGCVAASLVNPYGLSLHAHILEFMRADWIRELVEEFRPVRWDTAAGGYFAVLLAGAVWVSAGELRRRRYALPLLAAAWAAMAWSSVRHLPLFATLIVPSLGLAIADAFRRIREIHALDADYAASLQRATPFAAVLLAGVCLFAPVPSGYPAGRYPASIVARHERALAQTRIFTVDAWGDYLIGLGLPGTKVFFDGRTDLFGPGLTREYMAASRGEKGWAEILNRYGVEKALLPESLPLAVKLRGDQAWRLVESDGGTALLERRKAE